MKNFFEKISYRIPYFKAILKELNSYKRLQYYPAGHYYSPIVNWESIKDKKNIWSCSEIAGINFNLNEQLKLLSQFEKFYNEIPWKDQKEEGLNYYFKNDYFLHTDAIMLYSILRFFKPLRLIEVGSGFSSALMVDVNNHFLQNKLELCFIEPYTERLRSLLDMRNLKNVTIKEKKVQDITLENFEKLQTNDVLFIDSSHVCKTGGDVNHIIFKILPRLQKGVIIHFHDIFYPFEYPKLWVYQGRNWNEIYFLRAFLMNNPDYKVILFPDFLHKEKKESFQEMPLCYLNTGGSLWLQKISG